MMTKEFAEKVHISSKPDIIFEVLQGKDQEEKLKYIPVDFGLKGAVFDADMALKRFVYYRCVMENQPFDGNGSYASNTSLNNVSMTHTDVEADY